MSQNLFYAGGRVVADPEYSVTKNGKEVAKFRIAVERAYTKKGEQRKADFFHCEVIGEGKVQIVRDKLKKGVAVGITGIMRVSKGEKDGKPRTFFGIAVSNIDTYSPIMGLNLAICSGHLTADPELRTTTTGKTTTSVSIGVGNNFKNANGEYDTNFITFEVWESTAQFVGRNFRKGDSIGITGPWESREYINKEGEKRTVFEIKANSVHFAGTKSANATATDSQQDAPAYPQAIPAAQANQQDAPVPPAYQQAAPAYQAVPAAQAASVGYDNGDYDDFSIIGDDDDLPF